MKVSQNNIVLAALRRGPITALAAMRDFGILRLGARIYDLRRRGHRIDARNVRVRTRSGHATVARYTLGA